MFKRYERTFHLPVFPSPTGKHRSTMEDRLVQQLLAGSVSLQEKLGPTKEKIYSAIMQGCEVLKGIHQLHVRAVDSLASPLERSAEAATYILEEGAY